MSYTLLSEAHPKARKDHQCIWCGQTILKGTVYRSERSVYDGSMQNHKWHMECDLDARSYFKGSFEEDFDAGAADRPPMEPRFTFDVTKRVFDYYSGSDGQTFRSGGPFRGTQKAVHGIGFRHRGTSGTVYVDRVRIGRVEE